MAEPFSQTFSPPGPVAREFMKSDDFFRGLMGPVGSGKTVCCCVELFRRALEMPKDKTGTRRSRWAIVRNTTPQLKTTTVKTWLEWFPEDVFGKVNWTPPFTHHIRPPGSDLDLEVIFLALDNDKDIRKLLSLELTGVFINEAREVPKSIIDGCTQRVNRFPSRRSMSEPFWSGVIADTNAPPAEHWWPIMAGDTLPPEWMSVDDTEELVKPSHWSFYRQPPAMLEEKDRDGKVTGYAPNPDAENAHNLQPTYYTNMIAGKRRAWVNVYVLNRYDEWFDGQPIYPTFSSRSHVADHRLEPMEGHVIYCGIDFGLTPAVTFGQYVRGKDYVLRELVGRNIGTFRFAPRIKEFISEHFPGEWEFRWYGDPAGDQRAQTDERTPFDIMRAHGIPCHPAGTNDPLVRQGAVEIRLDTMVDGGPGYVISPCCTTLIRGFEGGYSRKDETGAARKDMFSHVHDAEQYRMLGRGAGREVRGQSGTARSGRARFSIDPHALSTSRPRFAPKGLR